MTKREEILSRKARRRVEPITLEDIDGVGVLKWMGTDRDEWEAGCADRARAAKAEGKVMDNRGMKAFIFVLSVVDAKTGKLIFKPGDADALNSIICGADIDRVYQVAQKVNYLLPEDIEELAGNSSADPSE